MMSTEEYSLTIFRDSIRTTLSIEAIDHAHAQAQATDITKSLSAEKFKLSYGKGNDNKLSDLYRRLAFSDFNPKECFEWSGSFTNNVPSVYVLGKRYYIRPLIQVYLDSDRDKIVKNTCNNTKCINPYHNHYLNSKNSKLSSGDHQMMLAFASQGVSVQQIAEALKVHRTTVYRNLNNERLHSGT
jgi:hypothetical protein